MPSMPPFREPLLSIAQTRNFHSTLPDASNLTASTPGLSMSVGNHKRIDYKHLLHQAKSSRKDNRQTICQDYGIGTLVRPILAWRWMGVEPKVIPNEKEAHYAHKRLPWLGSDKTESVGGMVRRNASRSHSRNTVFSIKRFYGTPLDEVQEEIKMVLYKVVNSGATWRAGAVQCSHAPQISALIFAESEESGGRLSSAKSDEAVIYRAPYCN